MHLSGAEIVLECLKKQGVEKIFGYPGGAMLPLYDALYKYQEHFTHILTSHEQGATHGADGYARVTGRAGVCFTTSGPGATNAITGMATAYMDSVPLVVFTGQVASPLLGKDSFQEVDITMMTLPITKHSYLVKKIEDLPTIIHKAFMVAESGRPGPVLIDIPKDILTTKTKYIQSTDIEIKELSRDCENYELAKAIQWINEAKQPVIYAGGGVMISDSSEELYKLSTKGNIPVANSLMGLGSFPRSHKLSLGMLGMHGLYESNMAITHSDLIIAIGSRFSDRVIGNANTFAKDARIIHIDIDRAEVSKNKEADLWLVGDTKKILSRMLRDIQPHARRKWLDTISNWRKKGERETEAFHPKEIIKSAWEMVAGKAIVTTEVGQHQMWVAQHWMFNKPRSFLTSGGLGTMGYGLGSAIGAKVALPNENVVHFTGDGSFRMNCNELATVSKYNLPIITILFNNATLGMVRQWQTAFYEERYSQTDITNNIDYVKLAESFGITGKRVKNITTFRDSLQEALRENKPMVIECILYKDQSVYPFVPAGKAINEMILE